MGRKALGEASGLPCRHSTRRRRLSAKTTAGIKASEIRAFAVLLDFHGEGLDLHLCVQISPIKAETATPRSHWMGASDRLNRPESSSSFLGGALKLDRPKSSSYTWELQFPESSETRSRHSAKTLFPRSLTANSHPHWKTLFRVSPAEDSKGCCGGRCNATSSCDTSEPHFGKVS